MHSLVCAPMYTKMKIFPHSRCSKGLNLLCILRYWVSTEFQLQAWPYSLHFKLSLLYENNDVKKIGSPTERSDTFLIFVHLLSYIKSLIRREEGAVLRHSLTFITSIIFSAVWIPWCAGRVVCLLVVWPHFSSVVFPVWILSLEGVHAGQRPWHTGCICEVTV